MMKIKPTNNFLQRSINGVSLYCRVVIVTKIKPCENLTDKVFYRRKIPELLYAGPEPGLKKAAMWTKMCEIVQLIPQKCQY